MKRVILRIAQLITATSGALPLDGMCPASGAPPAHNKVRGVRALEGSPKTFNWPTLK